MFLMNKFFDGEFMTFGLDVIAHMEADQEDRMDPMIYIFPRMTKCTFYKYGVSGEVRNIEQFFSKFLFFQSFSIVFCLFCRSNDMMQFVYYH